MDDFFRGDDGLGGKEQLRVGVEFAKDTLDIIALLLCREVGLVDDDDVGTFDLIDEEREDRFFSFKEGGLALKSLLAFVPLVQKEGQIDDCSKCIDGGEIEQPTSCGCGGDKHFHDGDGLCHPCALDEDGIICALLCEVCDSVPEVFLDRTADTPIGQFDNFFDLFDDVCGGFEERAVDIQLTDIVDDDSDTFAVEMSEQMIEQSCLSSPKKSRQNRYTARFL